MKNTLLVIYSTNILVRLLIVNMKNESVFPQKKKKMRDPNLVTHEKEADHRDTTIFSPTTAI